MLNEERIKLMSQMAKYEKKEGPGDFRISSYYEKDYASLNTWITVILSTIGYAIAAVFIFLIFIDVFFKKITLLSIVMMVSMFLAGYLIVVILMGVFAHEFYLKKHKEARERVKKFNHNLIMLDKMYEKEKK